MGYSDMWEWMQQAEREMAISVKSQFLENVIADQYNVKSELVDDAFHDHIQDMTILLASGKGGARVVRRIKGIDLARFATSGTWAITAGGLANRPAIIAGVFWALVELRAIAGDVKSFDKNHAAVLDQIYRSSDDQNGVTVNSIAKVLSLEEKDTSRICESLYDLGVINERDGRYSPREMRIDISGIIGAKNNSDG